MRIRIQVKKAEIKLVLVEQTEQEEPKIRIQSILCILSYRNKFAGNRFENLVWDPVKFQRGFRLKNRIRIHLHYCIKFFRGRKKKPFVSKL